MIKNSIPFAEPQWGKDLLVKTNELFVGNEWTVKFAPLLTDGLVLTYPVLLVVWYLMGLTAGREEMKYGALYVAYTAAVTVVVNAVIQFVIAKERPEGYIDNAEMLIMDHLPTEPFPSDHAAVGAAVAMATLLWGIKNDNIHLTVIGGLLLLGGIIMSVSRVGVAIHWPTDVLAGFILGCVLAVLIHGYIYEETLIRKVFTMIVSVQEWLFGVVGWGK